MARRTGALRFGDRPSTGDIRTAWKCIRENQMCRCFRNSFRRCQAPVEDWEGRVQSPRGPRLRGLHSGFVLEAQSTRHPGGGPPGQRPQRPLSLSTSSPGRALSAWWLFRKEEGLCHSGLTRRPPPRAFTRSPDSGKAAQGLDHLPGQALLHLVT